MPPRRTSRQPAVVDVIPDEEVYQDEIRLERQRVILEQVQVVDRTDSGIPHVVDLEAAAGAFRDGREMVRVRHDPVTE